MPNGNTAMKVQILFSLEDLKQIKGDLGQFSNDSVKNIDIFQNLIQVFDLTWGNVMLLLSQSLTAAAKQAVLQAPKIYRDEQHASYSRPRGKKKEIGKVRRKWKLQSHQEKKQFHLYEKAERGTNKTYSLSPASVEGQLILKDKFITRVAFNIRRKLQKQAIVLDGTLENLLRIATFVSYNKDQEEDQEKQRKYKRRTEALVAVLQACKVRDPWSASTSCYQCGKS
ncbi:putative transcript Y 10 protein, partial [Plecturocebus cupreus]